MSVLEKVAYLQGRKDEAPNQELAKELIETHDTDGIREIAENLYNTDIHVQNDCIKVLYEVVYVKKDEYNQKIFPLLIDHLSKFRPKEVGQHAESIFQAVNQKNRDEFIQVLKTREVSLTSAQLARINKLYKKLPVNP